MSKDEKDFDRAMQQIGVRRIRGGRVQTGKPRKGAAATPAGQASPNPPPNGPELKQAQEEAQAALNEAGTLRAQVAELQEELRDSADRVAHLEALLATPADANTGFQAVLERRGIRGKDEARRAILSLAEDRRWDGISSHLTAARPEALSNALDQGLFLHCGSSDCPAPESSSIIQVSQGRCEICGEGKLNWDALSDGLLLAGVRELIVKGGHPHSLGLLRQQVDGRVQVKALPAHAPDPAPSAQRPADARLLVHWRPNSKKREDCAAHSLSGLLQWILLELGRR